MEKSPTGRVGLTGLPYDLIRELCSLLQAVDISALLSTCHNLHTLSQDEAIWLELCRRYGVNETSIFGANSFREIYTELLHTYGPLLGLWASDHPYKGSIIEFRIDHELKGIVGEVWRFWTRSGPGSTNDLFRPNLPEYFRFMHLALAHSEAGHTRAQLNWHVPSEREDYYGPGTTSLNVPTLHVVSETDQEIVARLLGFRRIQDITLPVFPPLEPDLWYDRSRELPRLKRNHNTFKPTSIMGVLVPPSHISSATTSRISPPALMIRPPSPTAPDPFSVHEPRIPLEDVRNHIYHGQDIGWFYRRFYPLRSLVQQGQDPRDDNWRPDSLGGLWLGSYGPHGTEVLFLWYDAQSHEVQAWKVTGDMNVPRGVCSWKIFLNVPLRADECRHLGFTEFTRLYRGLGAVCSTGFIAADRGQIPAVVSIEGKDEIAINWRDLDLLYTPRYVRYKGRDVTSETKEHLLRRPIGWTP